jgi:hypothetical protein
MTRFRILIPLGLLGFLAACETSVPQTYTSSAPRQAIYRCSDDVTLEMRRAGSTVVITDSRGIDATLQASPAGQSTRYAEGIHALILEGETRPGSCRARCPSNAGASALVRAVSLSKTGVWNRSRGAFSGDFAVPID